MGAVTGSALQRVSKKLMIAPPITMHKGDEELGSPFRTTDRDLEDEEKGG